jgi:hypothetical protein
MKGMAQEQIIKIIVGLIVLGVIVTLLYIGIGPFREAVQFNSCKAILTEWCTVRGDFPGQLKDGCLGNFGGRGTFCHSASACCGGDVNVCPGDPGGATVDCGDV